MANNTAPSVAPTAMPAVAPVLRENAGAPSEGDVGADEAVAAGKELAELLAIATVARPVLPASLPVIIAPAAVSVAEADGVCNGKMHLVSGDTKPEMLRKNHHQDGRRRTDRSLMPHANI